MPHQSFAAKAGSMMRCTDVRMLAEGHAHASKSLKVLFIKIWV